MKKLKELFYRPLRKLEKKEDQAIVKPWWLDISDEEKEEIRKLLRKEIEKRSSNDTTTNNKQKGF